MPMCTYLGDTEHLKPTGHKQVDEVIAEMREQTGEDWRAGKHVVTERRLFGKSREHVWYSLYIGINAGEFQVINFFRDGTDWSINPDVSAELLVNYCYGYLGGDNHAKRRASTQPREGDGAP